MNLHIIAFIPEFDLLVSCSQSPECFACEDEREVRIHVTSAEEQDAVLSALDDLDSIKAIVPLDLLNSHTDDEKNLYEILTGHKSASEGSLDDLDGGERLPEELTLTSDQVISPNSRTEDNQDGLAFSHQITAVVKAPPLITLSLACLAAGLALGCIAGLLFVKYILRAYILDPEMALELLPRVEKHEFPTLQNDDEESGGYGGEKQGLLLLDVALPPQQSSIDSPIREEILTEKGLLDEPPCEEQYSSDEELNEKFHDAEELPLLSVDPPSAPIPQIVIHEHPDPDLIPLPLSLSRPVTPFFSPPPSPPRTPVHKPLQMREASSSPLAKPAWSIRAADAPALGLSSNSVSVRPSPHSSPAMRSVSLQPLLVSRPSTPMLSIPGALAPDYEDEDENAMMERPGGRRAYRAPVPELDIAFALQLRPGLGLGADPAWLVRFLMAMFGWMTVLIGGNKPRPGRRAIA